MATAARLMGPRPARQARATVGLDTADRTSDPTASRTAYPWLMLHPVTTHLLET
jgi:hypothetical protein